MSKILRLENEIDKNLKVNLKVEAAAASVHKDHADNSMKKDPEPTALKETVDPSSAPSAPALLVAMTNTTKDQASNAQQKSATKSTILGVIFLVAFFGLALLILNLELLDELKVSRESSIQLSSSVNALESRLSSLENYTTRIEKRAAMGSDDLKKNLKGMNERYESTLNVMIGQLEGFKKDINNVNSTLKENKSEITALNKLSHSAQAKIDEVNEMMQGLKRQNEELKRLLQPAVASK